MYQQIQILHLLDPRELIIAIVYSTNSIFSSFVQKNVKILPGN